MIPPSDRPPTLVTDRLIFREPRVGDLDALAAMWADKAVCRHIGPTRARQETWLSLVRCRGFWDLLGFGFWVIEERRTGAFLGEAGFADFLRGFTPDISGEPEAGWAFAQTAWNKGYGSEAAAAIHDWLDRDGPGGPSVCVIEPENTASLRIAEKLGYAQFATTLSKGTKVALLRRPASP